MPKKPKKIKTIEVELIENINRTLKIVIGKRWIAFHFLNGRMTGTEQSMPYEKSLQDWDFYALAIQTMRTQSKKWARNESNGT